MTLTDIEEYSLRLDNVLDCTIYNHITVGNVKLPKAVLSTVKIFAVCITAHRKASLLTEYSLK